MKRCAAAVGFVMMLMLWSTSLSAAPLNLVHQKITDYDGDGKHDIAVFDVSAPDVGTWYILQGGNGYKSAFSVVWGRATDEPAPADYDNDGRMDIAVYRPLAAPGGSDVGTWYILQGGTNFKTAFAVVWGGLGVPGNLNEPVPGDYDGDGKTDIAVWRNGSSAGFPAVDSGRWYILQGGTNFTTAFAVQWGVATPRPDVLALGPGQVFDTARPGDYDGDGRLDLCYVVASFQGADTGNWYILQGGSNFTTAFRVGPWGRGNWLDVPVPGDYDGDNRLDVAVFSSFSGFGVGPTPLFPGSAIGTWYILQGGTNFGSAFSVKWGVSTAGLAAGDNDVAVPADYDGDGRLDIAVFNQATNAPGTWYILQAGTSYTKAFSILFGAPGGFTQRAISARVEQGRYFGGLY